MRITVEDAFKYVHVEMKRGYWLRKTGTAQIWVCAMVNLSKYMIEIVRGSESREGWNSDGFDEYSINCGQPWTPIQMKKRGIQPGDVIVSRKKAYPLGYCTTTHIYAVGTNGLSSSLNEWEWPIGLLQSEYDIVYGVEADAWLGKIARGDY